MRWLLVVVIAFALLYGRQAVAGDLLVHVADEAHRPVSDAVITLTSELAPAARHAAPAVKTIDQKNETFLPYVQVLRPGDMAVFRNSDTTRHHVYSFSPVKSFEFVLRPGESSPPLTLERVGIAAVGCNIHDHMITYLYVSDADSIAVSGVDGHATLTDLAPGRYTLHVWHPQLHPGRPEITQVVQVNEHAAPPVAITLSLLPDPRMQMDREHIGY
ncbi:methylamine utilization protein [Dyella soli]|uniref:Methylamine utilization protein n=1 Tax=Dyella soli TaxID=522319 RepID=A0A4R0YMZ0_9GAMM|nr:hypothetical protein [Dyella soli]TCI08897.1 hypothetical protein EZM97_21870 [Dyella soli]